MSDVHLTLGKDIELILHEPTQMRPEHRILAFTSALVQEVGDKKHLLATKSQGNIVITAGELIYRVYYQFRVQRAMNALDAYSNAIAHIRSNPHLYDSRLAEKAIQLLRILYRGELD